MNPLTGDIEDTDLYAELGTAVEQVFLHLQIHAPPNVRVGVSHDADGELEGVGFFGLRDDLISCLTVYYLERDTQLPTVAAISEACRNPGPGLERQLNEIFKAV